jgi:hypothetical protein
VQLSIIYLAILLLARLLLRSTPAAWVGLGLVSFAMFVAWGSVFFGPHLASVGVFAVTAAVASVFVFWNTGLLALAVWFVVVVLIRDTPWTQDLTSWCAWPTWFTTALIAALAVWGFRNVLGRQSAFPAEP